MNLQNKNFKAKKSLGQNFLDAPHIVEQMVAVSGASQAPAVLEVGPGKGILTEALLKTGTTVIAVEKDDRAIGFLEEKFAAALKTDKLRLVHGDILEFEPEKYGLVARKYVIAANIPYYITGEFLRKFLGTEHAPSKMVLMLQKEVAERIVDEKESILSISVKAYGKPEYIATVQKEFFDPKPKVDSALLSIESISKDFFTKNSLSEQKFFEIVKAGFAHKRKIVRSNLESVLPSEILDLVWQNRGLSPKLRAENLKLDDWRALVSSN